MIEVSQSLKDFIKDCKSEIIDSASIKSIKEREEEFIRNGRADFITDELKEMWQAEIDKFNSIHQEEVSF